MPKVFTSEKQKIGELGENIAVKFLMKHDFSILDRNYTKKWGEIDIIAEKAGKIHFVEVKSVSRMPPYFVSSFSGLQDVSGETKAESLEGEYQPEDNMHPWKLKRLARTIQTYLVSKKVSEEKEWQLDLLVVYLNMKDKKARVKVVSDIIL